jgi:hypothetical protein
MNLREFYTKAVLASIPVAARTAFELGKGNPIYAGIEKDIADGSSLDEVIALLAHQIAYELSAHWGRQLDMWDESDGKPERTYPKTTIDRVTTEAQHKNN